MRRRGHGEGSIFHRKDGLWSAILDLGLDPSTGKRKRQTFYGKTRREVQQALHKALNQREQGMLLTPLKFTVAQYMERWLRDYAESTVKASTYDSYSTKLRLHVIPHLGHLSLTKLQPLHLQTLYTNLLKAGKSKRTVQYIHAILHEALDQAVKWQLLSRNPADAVESPRPERREPTVLTAEEVRRFLEAASTDPLFGLYYVAIATGMRRGELIGLRWESVDLTKGVLQVKQTLQRINRKLVFSEPKTQRSRRAVVIPEAALRVLRRTKAMQAEQRQAFDQAYQDHGLVFCNPNGTPLNPGRASRAIKRLLAKAGLPKIRLHDLRHTHATLLLEEGVHPKVVAERLGHSTITLTLDTYSHVLPHIQVEAAERIDKLLPDEAVEP